MPCPAEDNKQAEFRRLLNYIQTYNSSYSETLNSYTSATMNSVGMGSLTKVYKINTLVNASSAMEVNMNGRIVYVPLLSAI